MVSNIKPVYLLAGGRPRDSRSQDLTLESIFQESGKKSPIIAYSGTANGDNEDFFHRMTDAFGGSGAASVTHALIAPDNADIKKARDILEEADIIFIGGGDVDRGIKVLKEKEMLEFMKNLYEQGKLFFGSSAGAIMLAKEWVRWSDPDDSSSAELFPCLDLAPVICDCHDEECDWEELKTALRLKEDGTIGYGLTAGSAIKVSPEGDIEVLNGVVHPYIRHGKNVDRMADIRRALS